VLMLPHFAILGVFMAIKEGTSNHSAAYLGPIDVFEFLWPFWPYHSILLTQWAELSLVGTLC